MSDFTDLKSLYEHLEEHAMDYKYPHQIGTMFQKVRDFSSEAKKPEEAEKAQWEIDFFHFIFQKGIGKPSYGWTDAKGDKVDYPNFARFGDKTYEYLIMRLDSTNNDLLKARYAHILWRSPRKHGKYADLAVVSYSKLVKIYEEKDEKEPAQHFGLDVLRCIENAYVIACQVNCNIDDIKSEVKRIVKSFNFNSSSSFAVRANLIELMLNEKKHFSKDDFNGFQDVCSQTANSLTSVNNLNGAIDMLDLGEKVDAKLGIRTYEWVRKKAELYENLMNQRNPGDLAKPHFCQLAIENYKKVGETSKVEELEKKYIEFKNSMEFQSFEFKVDLTQVIRKSQKLAEELVKTGSDEIIRFLMFQKDLLPRYKDVEKDAEEQNKKSVFQQFAPIAIMDQRGHAAQHFSDEDEKKYYAILEEYTRQIELNKRYFINAIFFAGIQQDKLSAQILLEFLKKHSWFGKDLLKKLHTNREITYNWLTLIAPSLNEYFFQMRLYFTNPTNHPNLVLPIDSLTLKIEGLLRDLCDFANISTFQPSKDSKGRNITREKDVHALLYEDRIKEMFDGDDLLFFKFLLVEQAGYNLRHKIAHSLMFFQEYSIDSMHLLILALLRLGKYDFVEKQSKIDGKDASR
jgi:hypothetical protein